jgi:hypothetical protein
LKDFLDFNKKCPICNNELTLYMQVLDGPNLIYSDSDGDNICFKNNIDHYCFDKVYLNINDCKLDLDNSTYLTQYSANNIYFFYLCQTNSLKRLPGWHNFEIIMDDACYYRSSKFMDIKKGRLDFSDDKELINKDESFCIRSIEGDVEKIYALNMDYEDNTMDLNHFSVRNDFIKDQSKKKIFTQRLPLINYRFNFSKENRASLINKLNSWIKFS